MRRKISYNLEIILGSFLLLMFIGFTFFLIGKVLPSLKGNSTGTFLIIIAEIVLFGIGLVVFKLCMRFIKGDDGEMDIKFILDKLQGYYYLSDVMIGEKGNIDVVVIGQTGIWTIEVKNLSKKVINHDNYLDKEINQALAEKNSLQNFLMQNGISIPVTPVLVFTNKETKIHFGMVKQNGVYVIGKKWLEELLTKHSSGYLNAEECLVIKEKLKVYASRIN